MANFRAKTTLSRAELHSTENGPAIETMAQNCHPFHILETALALAPAAQETQVTDGPEYLNTMQINEVHRLNDLANHPQRLRGHSAHRPYRVGARNVFMGDASTVNGLERGGEAQVDQDGDVCMLDSDPALFDELDVERQSSNQERRNTQDDLEMFDFGSMGVPGLDEPEFEDLDGDFDSDFDKSDDETDDKKSVVDLTTEEEDVPESRAVVDLTTDEEDASQLNSEEAVQSTVAASSTQTNTAPRTNANVQLRQPTTSQQALAHYQARVQAQRRRQQSTLRITTNAEPTPAPSSQGHTSTGNAPFSVFDRPIPGRRVPTPQAEPASARTRRTAATRQPRERAPTPQQPTNANRAPFSVGDRGIWRTTPAAQPTATPAARTQPGPANTQRRLPTFMQPQITADGRVVRSVFDRPLPQARRPVQSQQSQGQSSAAQTSSQPSMQQQGPNSQPASRPFNVPQALRRLQPSTQAGSSAPKTSAHPNVNR